MKRVLLTLVILMTGVLAKSQDLSNSIEYSQLYIVGPATTAGWSDANALEMDRINDGVFKWEGELKGNEEFKFLNTRSWYKNVLSATPDVMVELAKTYNLDFYAAWDLNGKDWKFKMPKTGDYCIIVDLRNMKMSVSEKDNELQCPSKMYVTGSAVDNQVIELQDMYGVEFKKSISCKPGNILLINTPTITDNTVYYGPMYEDVDLTFGKGLIAGLSIVDKEARGWSVGAKGDYTLYIDENRFSYQGRKFVPRKVLYIVGGCCELNWNYWDESNKRFIPNPENPEELIWEGTLRIGSQEEPDRFKILTAESWTEETFHPYISDILAEGHSAARISGGDDHKWTIEKNGLYRLTFNTKNETLYSEYLGAEEKATPAFETGTALLTKMSESVSTIYVSNRVINIEVEHATDIIVRNLMGHTICSKYNHVSGAVTDSLPTGVYLVTIGNKTVKILIS